MSGGAIVLMMIKAKKSTHIPVGFFRRPCPEEHEATRDKRSTPII